MEPVVCELKYSGAVWLFLAPAAIATLAIVAGLPWSLPLRGSIALAVCGLTVRSASRVRTVRALRLESDAGLTLTLRDGTVVHGDLRDGSFVAHWLTLVRWRPPGAWFDRTVLLVPGMAQERALRRLRVRLRLG
jgi:hypothetical protein